MYLDRMKSWRAILGNAPSPLGVSREGRIVTIQKFIEGVAASVEEVRAYLISEGMKPVNETWFLWKIEDVEEGVEIWIGDARDENFVKSGSAIVPIDIRVWWIRPDKSVDSK